MDGAAVLPGVAGAGHVCCSNLYPNPARRRGWRRCGWRSSTTRSRWRTGMCATRRSSSTCSGAPRSPSWTPSLSALRQRGLGSVEDCIPCVCMRFSQCLLFFKRWVYQLLGKAESRQHMSKIIGALMVSHMLTSSGTDTSMNSKSADRNTWGCLWYLAGACAPVELMALDWRVLLVSDD